VRNRRNSAEIIAATGRRSSSASCARRRAARPPSGSSKPISGDPSTLANQVRKLRRRFRLKRIVLVGDRNMITQALIDADLEPAGFDRINSRRRARAALAVFSAPL
jgi:hypothetical protein